MAPKRTTKKQAQKPVVEELVSSREEVSSAQELAGPVYRTDEPEPGDDEDQMTAGGHGCTYFEGLGQFIRVHAFGGGLVTFVQSEDCASFDMSGGNAPEAGVCVSSQSIANFARCGWKPVAKTDVPIAWRKILARVRP